MTTLSPDLIRAVFAADEDALPETGYTPTPEDVRRALERLRYASAVVSAVDDAAFAAFDGALTDPTVATVQAARTALKARADRSSDPIRLARILLIDASRLLLGASEAIPV